MSLPEYDDIDLGSLILDLRKQQSAALPVPRSEIFELGSWKATVAVSKIVDLRSKI